MEDAAAARSCPSDLFTTRQRSRSLVGGERVLSGAAPRPVWLGGVTLVAPEAAGRDLGMDCVSCGSAAVTERPERTARGYCRFRCGDCGKQYNEWSAGCLNRVQYTSDVIALVVLWRLRYRPTLRDLAEKALVRGLVFSHEAVRTWESKLAPMLAEGLRRRRHGKRGSRGRHWHVDETNLRIRGRSVYLCRRHCQRMARPVCKGFGDLV